jgi:uncharacterized membrane protein
MIFIHMKRERDKMVLHCYAIDRELVDEFLTERDWLIRNGFIPEYYAGDPEAAALTNERLAAIEVTDEVVLQIVARRCASCHSFGTLDALRSRGAAIMERVVYGNTMPPGNQTGITRTERDQLGAWILSSP